MTSTVQEVDADLILRLSGPGRATRRIPPYRRGAKQWGSTAARAAHRRAAASPNDPLSLYVHLPFCHRRCLFCGCTVEVTRSNERVTRYLDALEREISMVAEVLGNRRQVTQLHWGGGTPTHSSAAELQRLHAMLVDPFEITPDAEVSIEVHPRVTTTEQIDVLAELGFNRVSLGVQDTDPLVQAVVNREQTVEDTMRVVDRCREQGVAGINIDLMYGLPGQTESTFSATLDTIAGIRPDRLAIYGYAHVPWIKPAQKVLEQTPMPDASQRARLFALAVQRLGAAGYEVIGLDHFALPTDDL